MARWRQALAAKPEPRGSASGAHMVEGRKRILHGVLWPPHGVWGVHAHPSKYSNDCKTVEGEKSDSSG